MQLARQHGWATRAINLPGHDGKANPSSVTSIHDYVEFVEGVVSSSDPVIIIGHSVGGLIAQAVASRCPKQVKGLVLVNSGMPRYIRPITLKALGYALQWQHLKPILLGRNLMPSPAVQRNVLLQTLDAESYSSVRDRFIGASGWIALGTLTTSYPIHRQHLRCPVQVVASMCDQFIPPSSQRRLAAKLRASIYHVPGAGHFPMLEDNWSVTCNMILNRVGGFVG